jgi:hypothetical protein
MAAYTAIDDPGLYFNTILWTGTDTARSITGYGFQPDLAWVKHRSAAYNHVIFDAVRTAGSDKDLTPVTNAAEGGANAAAYGYVSAFVSDGISLGEGTTNDSYVNTTDIPYVGWCWKAGTTSGISTNAATDITPSGYSFNATSGFSIIEYTGNTDATTQLPHGLGAVPHAFMVKNVSHADNWYVYHHKNTTAPETDYLHTNLNNATYDADGIWGDTAPDSVNITLGTDPGVNDSGRENIAYLWTEKQGFSKFGTYTGNGNADGPFVYTGFRPAFVMVKRTNTTGDWYMWDNKREGYNVDNDELFANGDDAEGTDDRVDLLSNGFKLRHSGAASNGSGDTFVYMAFAHSPLVNSSGVPCNAR